ncbi:OmpA family protein [Pseudomonas sp. GD04087]|uniref:OmpA family protein n=1 Tax=unclassified Pseudomonas TaxID=196821 RepID=UPI00244CC6C9|nr:MULTISPECIES: OmpA family protein [unclassified Pseudomonas]MDH0291115.1 OmpA family protein [Pseudomonas sp. GD04087]MDH1052346.1 OmpA family protein [Pseudomonas sp. GD03903]MDH2002988.1 OmpA family protein [Pseudomonas sp. GD03691]
MTSITSPKGVAKANRQWPLALVTLAVLTSLHAPLSGATETNQSIYGETYQKVESVAPEQAQIVMYRGQDAGKEAAHIYLDGHLQSALMPGGYTVFCTPAGEHSLESFIGDAPLYVGKRKQATYAKLGGGQTYVLEAPVAAHQSIPIVHTGKDAQQSLQGLRRQVHVISRAPSVVPCQTETKLSLRSDVLFHFAKGGYNDLTAEGRSQLGQVVQEIQQQPGRISGIEVIGHADPIGKAQANQTLSQQRAETVRRVLLEQGVQSQLVHASGRGSSEPVVQCNSGSRSEKIACNAPNRRVELVIQGTQNGD